jgi:hypothetical protein
MYKFIPIVEVREGSRINSRQQQKDPELTGMG